LPLSGCLRIRDIQCLTKNRTYKYATQGTVNSIPTGGLIKKQMEAFIPRSP
jgi:hypothetical protein